MPANSEHVLAVHCVSKRQQYFQLSRRDKGFSVCDEKTFNSTYIKDVKLSAIVEDLRDVVVDTVDVDLAWASRSHAG